jgi:hypothetical protein
MMVKAGYPYTLSIPQHPELGPGILRGPGGEKADREPEQTVVRHLAVNPLLRVPPPREFGYNPFP